MIKCWKIKYERPFYGGATILETEITPDIQRANVADEKQEGYFVTVEELRECFEAGMATEANPHDYPDLKQWLARKEVKGERENSRD